MWPFHLKPLSVQLTALEKSKGQRGFGFFMEMGLGKTAVTLAEFSTLLKEGVVDTLVVVCPESIKHNWKDEIENLRVPCDVFVWPKYPPAGQMRPYAWIFNYESIIHRSGEYLLDTLRKKKCMMVLDESSRIKNPNGRTSKKIVSMRDFPVIKRVLTGTPMTQSVVDLFPQLKFIGQFPNTKSQIFRNRFAIMGGWQGKQVVGIQNEVELQGIMEACSFRALKKDWTDLPEKIYRTRNVALSSDQKRMYNEMKRELVVMVTNSLAISAPMVITKIEKLQQISRGFINDDDGKTHTVVASHLNPAINVIKETLNTIVGKTIIMLVHNAAMTDLRKELAAWNPAVIAGKSSGLTMDQINDEKRRFNTDPNCRVILVQIQSGAEGHTLLGDMTDEKNSCSTMIFYENTFSLEKRKQAEDRNHRIGQKYTCTYIDLKCSPIDDKIVAALQSKQNLVKTVVDAIKITPDL